MWPFGYWCSIREERAPKGYDALSRGGEMIAEVTMDNVTYADAPQKFEAGTPQSLRQYVWACH